MWIYISIAIFITVLILITINTKKSRRVSVLAQAAYLSAVTVPEEWEKHDGGWNNNNFYINYYYKKDMYAESKYLICKINQYSTKKYETKRIVDFLNNRVIEIKEQDKKKESQRLMDLSLAAAQKKLNKLVE